MRRGSRLLVLPALGAGAPPQRATALGTERARADRRGAPIWNALYVGGR